MKKYFSEEHVMLKQMVQEFAEKEINKTTEIKNITIKKPAIPLNLALLISI